MGVGPEAGEPRRALLGVRAIAAAGPYQPTFYAREDIPPSGGLYHTLVEVTKAGTYDLVSIGGDSPGEIDAQFCIDSDLSMDGGGTFEIRHHFTERVGVGFEQACSTALDRFEFDIFWRGDFENTSTLVVMTIQESFGREVKGLKVAWIGDGNNMANSWLNAAYRLGLEVRIACPEGYDPDGGILDRAKGASKVMITRSPAEAADGADVVTTDVWASMGQEGEAEKRMKAFEGFQVSEEIMEAAGENAIFLHCLPAHRGEEVTDGVIEGPRSRVFDEAENRLHAQKAIMIRLMGGRR